jgi:hypothetical protein
MMLRPAFTPDPDTQRRYFWTCAGPYRADAGDGKGCGAFSWQEFDADGKPIWKKENGEEKS